MTAILACCQLLPVYAQEVSFTPRFDGVSPAREGRLSSTSVHPESSAKEQVYSFARFNVLFREICVLLEADGRREVLFRLVSKDLQEATDCPWCRALYRQFVQECGERPRLAGVLNGAKRPESGGAASPKNPGQTNRSRYPRTDLIEVLSRLSEGLYDLSPGGDGVLSALRLFRDQMLGMPKLTPAERDYFDVMCEYLMSAWQGRFKASNHVPTPSSEEIAELFQ